MKKILSIILLFVAIGAYSQNSVQYISSFRPNGSDYSASDFYHFVQFNHEMKGVAFNLGVSSDWDNSNYTAAYIGSSMDLFTKEKATLLVFGNIGANLTDNIMFVTWGGAVKYNLSKRWFLYSDLRLIWQDQHPTQNMGLGIGYNFTKKE